MEAYEVDEKEYGIKSEKILAFEKNVSSMLDNDKVLSEEYGCADAFSLKQGHLIALQEIASQMKAEKGPIYRQWLAQRQSPTQLIVIRSKGKEMQTKLLTQFPDLEMTFNKDKVGADHPYIKCKFCSIWLKSYSRLNKKGTLTRYDSTGVKRHMKSCEAKANGKMALCSENVSTVKSLESTTYVEPAPKV